MSFSEIRSKRSCPLIFTLTLLVTGVCLFYIKVGGLIAGAEQVDHRLQYCFDVATDSTGRRLFVASGRAGLHILNVEEGHLHYDTTYYDGGYYRNLKMWQDRVYVADSERGLVMLDISGSRPVTTWVQPEGKAGGVDIEGGKAYVAAFENGLQIFDISNSDSPELLSSIYRIPIHSHPSPKSILWGWLKASTLPVISHLWQMPFWEYEQLMSPILKNQF
jgi:hypothetical protein